MKIEPFMLHKSTLGHLKNLVKKLLEDPSAMWEVRITKWSKKRTLSQNSLSHVWYAQIAKHAENLDDWNDDKKVKINLKKMFLGTEVKTCRNGITKQYETYEQLRETSKLSDAEMNFYLNQIQRWALDINLILTSDRDSQFQQINKEMENE